MLLENKNVGYMEYRSGGFEKMMLLIKIIYILIIIYESYMKIKKIVRKRDDVWRWKEERDLVVWDEEREMV